MLPRDVGVTMTFLPHTSAMSVLDITDTRPVESQGRVSAPAFKRTFSTDWIRNRVKHCSCC